MPRFAPRRASALALTVALALACALTGCGRGGASSTVGAEAPLELLVPTDAETLDPRYATDATGMRVSRLLHAGLVRLDERTLAPQPYVARELAWVDDFTLRVTLRTDVRFASGAPLEAEDVVQTIRAFGAKEVASRHARVVAAIASVSAEGPHTVLIKLGRPHATLLTDLELPILRRDQAFAPPTSQGAALDGLGPYVLEAFAPSTLTLAPRDGGALPRPTHAVRIQTVRDENARALRVHGGRADVAVNAFSPALLPALEAIPGVRVVERPGASLTYMVMRVDRPPFASEGLRHALARALDKELLARTFFAGRATAATTLLPPEHWAFAPKGKPAVPYDAEGARARVAAAVAADPTLGPRPRVTWLTSTDRLRVSIARFAAQELGKIGLDVEVVSLELGALLARLGAGDFELATLVLPELTEPNVLRVFLHSDAVPPAGANRGRVRDPEVDALLERAGAERDPEVRRGLYAKLDDRVEERAWLLPLLHEAQVAVVSGRAAGFAPSAEGRWLGLAFVP